MRIGLIRSKLQYQKIWITPKSERKIIFHLQEKQEENSICSTDACRLLQKFLAIILDFLQMVLSIFGTKKV